MASHSKSVQSASLADHSVRAEVGTGIKIEGQPNSIYTLTAVEINLKSVEVTTHVEGALIELENDAVDWKPFEVYTNLIDEITSTSGGGASQTSLLIRCHKSLPVGSTVHVYQTSLTADTDTCYVILHWIENQYDGQPQTFIKAGKGSALTQVTVAAAHVSITIPANKGGQVKSILLIGVPTIEAGVSSGGKVAVHNQSVRPTIEPLEFVTNAVECVVAGMAEIKVQEIPVDIQCPANSTFTFDYTPEDNQSQYLAAMIKWE